MATYQPGEQVEVCLRKPLASLPDAKPGEWRPGTVDDVTPDGRFLVQVDADPSDDSTIITVYGDDLRRPASR